MAHPERDARNPASWISLALMVVASAAFAFIPNSWLWGLAPLRFAPSIVGWCAWSLAVLSFIPPVSRALGSFLGHLGTLIDRQPRLAAAVLGAASAGLVLALPDRTWFIGDFQWRQMNLEAPSDFGALYHQALALERLLHDAAPRVLMRLGLDANDAGRVLGAFAAVLWSAAAVFAARAFGWRGTAAGTGSLVIVLGGALTLMTGYDKALMWMPALALCITACAMRVVHDGRGTVALGISLALALLLHRSSLVFVPGVACALLLARGRVPVRDMTIAIAAPLVALGVVAAPAIRSALDYDRAHFTSDGGLSGWFSPVRIADLASALLFYAPLAGLILVLAPSAVRADRRRAAVLLALGVPLLLLSFVVHPAHGVFRDIDVHAAAGAFAALLAAWAIAEFVSQAPENSRFGAAAVTTALALTIAWLALAHDVDRGVARVEAFVREPPTRSARDVAGAWDFLGFRLLELGRVDASAYAFERVADLQPTPRVLRQWASVELRRGNWDAVAAIWRGLLERDPANVRLWSEWLALAGRNGDVEGARAAAAAILRLDPTNAFAREALARLAAGRDSARTTER